MPSLVESAIRAADAADTEEYQRAKEFARATGDLYRMISSLSYVEPQIARAAKLQAQRANLAWCALMLERDGTDTFTAKVFKEISRDIARLESTR